MNYLSEDQLAEFDELGYLVFEGLCDPQHNQRIKDDVDLLMIDCFAGEHKPIICYDELGALTSEPCVVDRVTDLMAGEKFAHHHIHARWQNVRWRVPTLERPTAIATATVFDPASLPLLSEQTVDLDTRYAGRHGQKAPHGAFVALAQCPVAEPTEQLAHKSVGARQILVFIVRSLVAFGEGPNLLHSV